MEGTNYHVCVTIIGLLKASKNAKQIHMLLKLLKVSECFVYRVPALYNNTGDIVDQSRSWRPHTAHTKKVVEAVRACINQNPACRQKIIAKEMNIAPRTLSHILKDDLSLRAFKRRTGQLLTPRLRALRCERAKKLLCLYGKGKYKKILFTDKKILR